MYGLPILSKECANIEELNALRKQLLLAYQSGTDKNASWKLLNTRYKLKDGIAIDFIHKLSVDLASAMRAHKFFKHRNPGEDELQDTLLRSLEMLKTADINKVNEYGITTYVIKVCRSAIMNHLRDTLREENRGLGEHDLWTSQAELAALTDDELIDRSPMTPHEEYVRELEVALLEYLQSQLPERQQLALEMKLDDKTYKEIADVMGVSVGTVKQTLHQAKGNLAAYYNAKTIKEKHIE
jgi:RNA polymerase sigma-70 factor (ECF subfamily)